MCPMVSASTVMLLGVFLLGLSVVSAAQDGLTTARPSAARSAAEECLLTDADLSSDQPAVAELVKLMRQLTATPAPLPEPAVRQLARLTPGLRQLAALLAPSETASVSANVTTRRLRAPAGAMAFERELAAAHLAEIRADLKWTALASPCRQAVRALLDGVDMLEDWAWEMFDSNGKPEAGFSDGNSFWEGRFSQCNGVLHEALLVNGSVHIKGRYYKAQLTGLLLPDKQSFRVTVGTCFPDLCTDADVKTILNDAPGFMSLPNVPHSAVGVTFRTDDVIGVLMERHFWQDYTAVSALATVLLFATLAVAGTVVDVLYEDGSGLATSRHREEQTTKSEQTKLVEGRPASYSALEQEAPPSATDQP